MTEHDTTHDGEIYRAGFACLVGRPNAGKSTLTNALVGDKVAITSSKPQTTRHTIRGIVTRPDGQIVLVDTPVGGALEAHAVDLVSDSGLRAVAAAAAHDLVEISWDSPGQEAATRALVARDVARAGAVSGPD